jgi:hypothetical protein
MSDPAPFLPVTAEGWSTLVANSIAILTFVLGRRAFISWATSMRRALEGLRFVNPSGAAPPEVTLKHHHIHVERPVADGRWHIHWLQGSDPTQRTALAKITSLRLRWHLRFNPKLRDLLVIGELRYLDTADGAALVEVSAVDHITRGGIPGWLAVILFG